MRTRSMKTRGGHPLRESTVRARSSASRKSVDDDNAPSVTPTSPWTNFASRAPPPCSAFSTAADLKQATEKLKARNLTAARSGRVAKQPRKSSLKSSSDGNSGSRRASAHGFVPASPMPGVRFGTATFAAPASQKNFLGSKNATKPDSKRVVTIRDLAALNSPRSPTDRRSSRTSSITGGGDEIKGRAIPVKIGSQEWEMYPSRAIPRRSVSWSGPTGTSSRSATRDSVAEFERRHRAGRRLGSFGSQGGKQLYTRSLPGSSILGKRSSSSAGFREVDDVDGLHSFSSENNGKRRRWQPEQFNGGVALVEDNSLDAIVEQNPGYLAALDDNPELLDLPHVGPTFTYLQSTIQSFAEDNFSFDLTPAQRTTWPLHQLTSRYLPLLLITQFIADGSQYGWRNFFTQPASRSALVYGIIGEWLKQRVFYHTAFGFSDDEVRTLEDMDREYLHSDAFLRTKKRAAMIRGFLAHGSTSGKETLAKACEELTQELMVVIAPLMPGFVEGNQNHDTNAEIREQLYNIVRQAAVFHRAIRVLGKDGTLVRIAPSVQKGEKYAHRAPFHIINEDMVANTQHHAGNAEQQQQPGHLKIRMTCFSRVESFVPNGPDHEELAQREQEIKELIRKEGRDPDAEGVFDWEEWAHVVWPQFPQQVVGDVYHNYTGSSLVDVENGGDQTTLYGSYISCFSKLAEHQVYCEWDQAETDQAGEKRVQVLDLVDDEELIPIPKSQRLSLKQAVAQARREVGAWKHGIEDGAREIWNFVCRWESILESGALIWFIQSWLRGGSVADGVANIELLTSESGRRNLLIKATNQATSLQWKYDNLKKGVLKAGLGQKFVSKIPMATRFTPTQESKTTRGS